VALPEARESHAILAFFYEAPGGQSVPLYEYKCQKCARHTEKIEKVDGPHLKKCPHCGGKAERLISRTSMQFKGSGWYVTDYASKGPKSDGDSSKTPPPNDSKESPGKDASEDSRSKDASAKESSKDAGKESKKSEEKKPVKKK
jgi:putative FmdB family regulatory protein